MLHDTNPDDPAGAAVRWSINYSESNTLQLCLLALPQPASHIEGRPAFKRDFCPAIFLDRFELVTKMSSVARPRGTPQPVVFNDNPTALYEQLETTPSAFLRIEEGNLQIITNNK
jgi:hypothetical protein